MEAILAKDLTLGQRYYIESVSDKKSRQIGLCQKVIHIKEDMYEGSNC